MYLHPAFEVKIGSLPPLKNFGLEIVDIAVRMSMDSAPGHFESDMKLGEGIENLKKNEDVQVSLGYEENGSPDLSIVFTGKVKSIKNTGQKTLVLSPLTTLYNLRFDQPYHDQTSGQIISDIAERAEIEVGEVADGSRLPSYVINQQKNAFEHIVELAKRPGFDFHADNEGKLVFKKYEISDNPRVIEYGKNILSVKLVDRAQPYNSFRVAGTSPSGTKGQDKQSWLTKRSIEGRAGSGSNELLVQDMSAKDPDSAQEYAESLKRRSDNSINVELKILGDAKIMLGDTVRIENVPETENATEVSLNGDFLVRELEHAFSSSEGFTTTLKCRKDISRARTGISDNQR